MLTATVSPADARKSKASQHPRKRAAPARGCPELDTMTQWCTSVRGNPGATRRHATGDHDQQRDLAEKMKECRRTCEGIAVNTEARLRATLDVAPHVRQLATEGGRGLEKCPVAGEMHTMRQLRQTLRAARATAAVEATVARERLGVLFVANAPTATPKPRVVLGCARGCVEQLVERHENWMDVTETTDGAGDEGQQRQDADGRRRAEQKSRECVLEQMDPPERVALQARVNFPKRLPGASVEQRKVVMDRARDEWEVRVRAAIEQRPHGMPRRVSVLADTCVTRARQDECTTRTNPCARPPDGQSSKGMPASTRTSGPPP